MLHRKNTHKVPTCKNIKEGKVCDKPDEVCWYPHDIIVETQKPDPPETNVINVAQTEKKLDFCSVIQKKAIPIVVSQEAPTKTELLMMEMIQMMREQHKATLHMMLSWTQKNTHMN